MKYWRFVFLGLGLLFLFYYFFVPNIKDQPNPLGNQAIWETKSDEREPVLIKVTPLKLGADENSWKFELSFTTHSGDLDIDPTKAVSLVDDTGKSFQATSWEGLGPGGHHISGNLIFNQIKPTPKYIELKIKDIGDIPERSFRWDVQ